jgi:hypothetical protein
MAPMMNRHDVLTCQSRYLRAGWILLAMAVLAIAIPILATAARPHVVWLFGTSYGAVAMVLGVTLIRVGHGRVGRRTVGPVSMQGFRAWHRW